MSLMIPAVTLSDVSFHALGASSQRESTMFNRYAWFPRHSHELGITTNPEASTQALGLEQPVQLSTTTGSTTPSSSGLFHTLESQSLSVPIYAAYSQASDALSPFDSYQLPAHPGVFTPSTTVDSRPRPSNPSSSPGTSTADTNSNQTPCPPLHAQANLEAPSSQPQPQRNAERMRQRLTQTEADNEELRETHRASRVGLGRAQSILDEVLDLALPDTLYEKLAGVSEILGDLLKKLR